jgi:hypothetical protein
MLDQLFTPQFWNAQWAVVMSAPWLTIPLLLLAGLVGLCLQRWRDGGVIDTQRTIKSG